MNAGRPPEPLGLVEIGGIRAYGKHGALPGERETDQPFALDVVLHVDLRAAGRSDELGDTVDYAAVAMRAIEIVRRRSYRLLERLADEIVTDVMHDERVRAASVRIAKPNILAGATPAVTVFRDRAPG